MTITQKDLIKLNDNPYFHSLMNWVENSLRMTKNLVSPEFFHSSFTTKQKNQIVSMIYTIYPNVKDIKPVGSNGVVIICDDYLDTEKTQKNIDMFFKSAHQKAKRGSNRIKPKKRRK